MVKSGWISINREISGHWIFDDSEYFKAWICILLEVNHEPGRTVIKKKTLECDRGESLKSLETWGTLFGSWSKGKVNRFFKLLESHDMITLKNEHVTTRLSVCNYTTYQNTRNASGAADGTQTERTRTTNNNDNNKNNDNKEPYATMIKEWWNKKISPMGHSELRGLKAGRLKKAKARGIENHLEEIQAMVKTFKPFVYEGSWFSFDWLVKNDENLDKLLEGKYSEAKEEPEQVGFTTHEERGLMWKGIDE